MRARSTFSLAAAAASLSLGVASAQNINPWFVHETGNTFFSQPDLNGDDVPDVVMVDAQTGIIRSALWGDGPEWLQPVAGGINAVTSVAVGLLEAPPKASIALTSPEANRINLFSLAGSGLNPAPRSAFTEVWGLSELAIIEEGNGAGGTEELVGFSTVFEPSLPGFRDYTAFNGSTLESYTFGAPFPGFEERDYNRFQLEPGLFLLGYFEMDTAPGVDDFKLIDTEGGSFDEIVSLPAPAGSRVVQASFDESGVFQFIFYEPEGTAIRVYAWNGATLEEVGTDTLSFAAGTLFPYVSSKSSGFVSVSPDGEQVAYYEFDGNLPVSVGSAPLPASELPVRGFLGHPDGTLLVFSGLGETPTHSERLAHNGLAFESLGDVSLPASGLVSQGTNVLLFSETPFVSENAPLSGRLGSGLWTSAVSIGGTVEVVEESYAGPQAGLQNPVTVDLGSPPPDTNDGLPNQVDSDIALYDSGAPLGALPGSVLAVPDPGAFSESIRAEFVATGNIFDIFYRILPDGNWINSSGPTQWFFEDVSIAYFGMDGSGRRTPARTADYTIALSADDLDSDGDGVPDYVEIENGLDPVNSGADSDDDGFSDLEEILAGTLPNDPSSMPPPKELDSDGDGFSDFEETLAGTLPNDDTSKPASPGVLDFQNVFDLVGTPLSHDGTAAGNPFVRSLAASDPEAEDPQATDVRLYSLSSSLLGFDRTANHGIAGAIEPNALIGEVAVSNPELPLVVSTQRNFPVDVPDPDPLIGRQIAALVSQPEPVLPPVPYTFGSSGGTLAGESTGWTEAAKAHFLSIDRDMVIRSFDLYDTLVLLLTELKLEKVLISRGILSGGDPLTLTGFRSGESAVPLSAAPGDGSRRVLVPDTVFEELRFKANPADTGYLVNGLYRDIETVIDTDLSSGVLDLRAVAEEIYRLSAVNANANTGSYLPPLDSLRQFIRTGSLENTGYGGVPPLATTALASAYAAIPYIIGQADMRPVEFRELLVLPGGSSSGCTVLEDVSNSDSVSLLDSLGNPYPFPDAFEIPAGSVILVEGYADVTSACGAAAVLEVIPPVQLVSLPEVATSDANSNLIPDDLEDLYPQSLAPFADSDGDGYSDLQEILEGTDPFNSGDFPGSAPLSLVPPVVDIDESSPTTFTLSFSYPGTYADDIGFRLFAGPTPQDMVTDTGIDATHSGGDSFQLILNQPVSFPIFYRFQMQLK